MGVPSFYNIATLERKSWFNPGMEKHQKWQERTAQQEKAAQELITARQQRDEYKGCIPTIPEQDELNRSGDNSQVQSTTWQAPGIATLTRQQGKEGKA